MLTGLLLLALSVAPDRVFTLPASPPTGVSSDPTPDPKPPEKK